MNPELFYRFVVARLRAANVVIQQEWDFLDLTDIFNVLPPPSVSFQKFCEVSADENKQGVAVEDIKKQVNSAGLSKLRLAPGVKIEEGEE
jgi:hypothetical protein